MRRDYEKIFRQQVIVEFDDFQAFENDIILDRPDHHIEDLVRAIVNDAITDEGLSLGWSVRDSIDHLQTFTDEDIHKFCTEFREYEFWALYAPIFVDADEDNYMTKLYCKAAANSLLAIFDYYHSVAYPRYWFKTHNASAPEVAPTPAPLPKPSISIDSFIITDNKDAFKAAMSKLLTDTKGKQAAIYIYMAVQKGYLKKTPAPLLQSAFHFDGTISAFNNAFSKIVATPKQYRTDLDDAFAAFSQVFDEFH